MPGQGPLPSGDARRSNAPAIASTVLPRAGRTARAPTVPKPYRLGKAGAAWWRWAWKLPQATQWDSGTLYFVVRRAQLEDDLAAREIASGVDLDELLAGADREAIRAIGDAFAALHRIAAGSTALMREARELDNRLGLNPKAMAELRWSVAAVEAAPAAAGRAPPRLPRRGGDRRLAVAAVAAAVRRLGADDRAAGRRVVRGVAAQPPDRRAVALHPRPVPVPHLWYALARARARSRAGSTAPASSAARRAPARTRCWRARARRALRPDPARLERDGAGSASRTAWRSSRSPPTPRPGQADPLRVANAMVDRRDGRRVRLRQGHPAHPALDSGSRSSC
jgi:hypothetical protein